MPKSILDDILVSDKKNLKKGTEDQILKPLLSEINLITDNNVKSFVRSLLLKAEGFWEIPASFTGNNHPPDERGRGGNVLHTKRVVRIAALLTESYSLSNDEKDVVIAASLLHDLCKGARTAPDQEYRYDPMHPYAVGRFVAEAQGEDKKFSSDSESTTIYLQEEIVQSILRLVRCHLGPWSPVPETFPITYLDYIVHIADNVASKIHQIIQDSDLINREWKINGSSAEN